MRDYYTRAAALAKWNGSTVCTTAVPGGLFEGDKLDTRPSGLYAIVACKPDGKPNQFTTGSGKGTDNEIDFRRLTITIYGVAEADVATAMLAVDGVFASRPDTFAASALTITGATWMRTEPIAENPDAIERAERLGSVQWWKGPLSYRVWSSRNH